MARKDLNPSQKETVEGLEQQGFETYRVTKPKGAKGHAHHFSRFENVDWKTDIGQKGGVGPGPQIHDGRLEDD